MEASSSVLEDKFLALQIVMLTSFKLDFYNNLCLSIQAMNDRFNNKIKILK